MRRLLQLSAAALAVALLAACGERGDKAIAYGDGLGQEWVPAGEAPLLRISVQNSFTRDVIVRADAPGSHYELTVGPIRERYMIVPLGKYDISAVTKERDTGNTKLWVNPDDRGKAKGLLVKVRP
jgi:hypothetical protein